MTITKQIALQASYEMGRYAAKRGDDTCPLTCPECIARWNAGFADYEDEQLAAWEAVHGPKADPWSHVEFPFADNH